MNNHGQDDRSRQEGQGYNRIKSTEKGHVFTIDGAIDNDFKCGQAKSAGLFEKSKRNLIYFIRQEGDNEVVLVKQGLGTMMIQIILIPLPPNRGPGGPQ